MEIVGAEISLINSVLVRITPAFSVTCIGDIFVHLSTGYVTIVKHLIVNIYIAQIPCEYVQMRETNKYGTN